MSFIIRSQAAPTLPREGLNFWFDAENHPSLGNSDISVDRTGNYANFSLVNSATKVSYNTNGGGSFDFSGNTNVYIKTPINITSTTNTVTWVLWFRRSGTPVEYTGLFYNRTTGGIAGINFGGTGNTTKLRYTWNNGGYDAETSLTTPTNIWTFCALSVRSNGATFTMISATGSKSTYSTFSVTHQALAFTSSFLGWDGFSNRLLAGRISQAFFYTRDLSDTEVQDIYNTTVSRHQPLGFQPEVTTTTTTTSTSTTSTTTILVYEFVGREGVDKLALCDGEGSNLSLFSLIQWASLRVGDTLFTDSGLQDLWKDSQFFRESSKNEYLEIDQGTGEIVTTPTPC
jgi:hypothetical protein